MVLRHFLRRVRSDENAATAIEYGLIAGMIAVVIIGISATGGSLTALYDKLTNIIGALGDGGTNGGG